MRIEEADWREVASAPRDGTFVRLQRFGLLGTYPEPEVGQWREEPSGFKGWLDRDGQWLPFPPTHWQPEHGSFA